MNGWVCDAVRWGGCEAMLLQDSSDGVACNLSHPLQQSMVLELGEVF